MWKAERKALRWQASPKTTGRRKEMRYAFPVSYPKLSILSKGTPPLRDEEEAEILVPLYRATKSEKGGITTTTLTCSGMQKILEWVAISFSRNLPNPGMEPTSLASPAEAGGFFTTAPMTTCCFRQSQDFKRKNFIDTCIL